VLIAHYSNIEMLTDPLFACLLYPLSCIQVVVEGLSTDANLEKHVFGNTLVLLPEFINVIEGQNIYRTIIFDMIQPNEESDASTILFLSFIKYIKSFGKGKGES
jgi:hypothetical protein